MRLRVLAADDEPPALDELSFLLNADPRVGEVVTASSAVQALALLENREVDAAFLDIRMPGMSGLQLARLLARFHRPPAVVFVTAYDGAAVDAFDLHAVDYLLKPLRQDRLGEAVRRVLAAQEAGTPGAGGSDVTVAGTAGSSDEVIPVELAGVTRFLPLATVRYAEAQGDYVRLHTATGSHLLRAALSALEERWAPAGFVRIHRSYLVGAQHITELRVEPTGGHTVRLGDLVLPVSRRHTRALKDRLVHRAKRAWEP